MARFNSLLRSRPRRPAFTLVEMLVSLAVLTLALSVVGVVFTVTTKAAGQAVAYSETQNWVGQFMDQLAEDLRFCDREKSVLVLVGRTQAASLTQADLEANKYYRVLVGDKSKAPANYDPAFDTDEDNSNWTLVNYSDPRADIMMFFTQRPCMSAAPPPEPTPVPPNTPVTQGELAANGAKFSPVQVVYGHAALAQPQPNGTGWQFPNINDPDYVRHIEQLKPGNANNPSKIPAVEWQLARRATLIWPYSQPNTTSLSGYFDPPNTWDRIVAAKPALNVTPPNGVIPSQSQNVPGDATWLDHNLMLEKLSPGDDFNPDLAESYAYDLNTWDNRAVSMLRGLLYHPLTGNGATAADGLYHPVAMIIPEPPADLRSNMALQGLPGCVWFQIEFLMPEDPRNSVEYTPPMNVSGVTNPSPRSDELRWMAIQPGKTYVFVPDTRENRDLVAQQATLGGVSKDRLWTFLRKDQDANRHTDPADAIPQRNIRMWPYAIRVTVRAYDRHKRLEHPIVRTLVHRFD